MTTPLLPVGGPWTPEQVKAAREALGFTQAELADALELGDAVGGKDTVRNWERGKRPISGPSRVAIRLMLGKGKRPAKSKPASNFVEPVIGKGAAGA